MKNKVSWFYYAGRWLTWFFLRLLTDWSVRGKENIPEKGPVLIVSNHMNNVDPPLIAVSVPHKLVFMSKEELFRSKFVGYFIAGFGAFPVRRGQLGFSVLRRSRQILAQGWGLVMFPEGMRSQDGCMLPAFPGSAAIAAQNDVPVLPVGITGTEQIHGISWIFKRPELTVTIGKPFFISHNGKVTREQLAGITDEIMCRIATLLPVRYHGCYSGRVAKHAN